MALCVQKRGSGEQGRVLGRHLARERDSRVCCRDEWRVRCQSGKKQLMPPFDFHSRAQEPCKGTRAVDTRVRDSSSCHTPMAQLSY